MHVRAAGAAMIALVLLPGTADAHPVGDSQKTAGTSKYCVWDSSMLKEDSKDNGYTLGRIRTYKGDCTTAVNRDVQFLSLSFLVYFSRQAGGDQQLCVYTDWYYNAKPEWGFGLEMQFPDRPYCGHGWYEVYTVGYLYADKDWRGGFVRSGEHYLND
jgi:hypothetical protein